MSLATQVSGPAGAPTILFLHGFGTSSWMWADQVEALSVDLRCVTVDLPGFGRSRAVPWDPSPRRPASSPRSFRS